MSKQLTRKQQGFTIIEVMIVLAIAALILLAVFLAIPNLQRSSRNSGRKADAGRIGTSATNFRANNNGLSPATAGDATTILTDAGTLSQYTLTGAGAASSPATACAAGSAANGKLTICSGVPAAAFTALTAGQDGMVLATSAQCSSTSGLPIAGTSRQMALYHTVETSGAPTWACVNL
jgi:prepilin-type N-terminal cleavage/methylation domain-containing protein